jgi:hypothetical protein
MQRNSRNFQEKRKNENTNNITWAIEWLLYAA